MASLLEEVPHNHTSQWSLPLKVVLLSLVAELKLFQGLKLIVLFSSTPLFLGGGVFLKGDGLLSNSVISA